MFRSFGGTALVLFSLGAPACSPVSNDTAGDPAARLDEAVFQCKVEPVLAKYCSYNACHGIAGTSGQGAALRVYTPGKLRATTPTDLNAQVAALTPAEHHANFESAAGFSFNVASVDDNFLLRKPLPSIEGGYEHQGGAIYASTTDASYLAIHDWLTGQGKCP
jgi:hypothetical protein